MVIMCNDCEKYYETMVAKYEAEKEELLASIKGLMNEAYQLGKQDKIQVDYIYKMTESNRYADKEESKLMNEAQELFTKMIDETYYEHKQN